MGGVPGTGRTGLSSAHRAATAPQSQTIRVAAGLPEVPCSSSHSGCAHRSGDPIWTAKVQSMSCKCPLRQPATKRIGVTALRRPSSSTKSARPRGLRSRQRTSRRRRTSPTTSASRATNHAGKMRASIPGGSARPFAPSSCAGGVRSDRRTPSSSRPPARSSVSSTATARGSWIGRQLPRSRMCHRSSPPMMTDRVGRSTMAPGPKPVMSCDWRSVGRCPLMSCLRHR